MRIALDGLPLQVRSAGIAVYTAQLVSHVAQLRPEWDFILLQLSALGLRVLRAERVARVLGMPGNVRPAGALLYPLTMGYPLSWLPRLFTLEHVVGAMDLFHATNYAVPRRGRTPAVLTVHDLALLRFPALGTPALRRLLETARQRMREVRFIIADSQATARDVIELCGVDAARVRTVPLGCEAEFELLERDAAETVVHRAFGIRQPYVLHVGTLEPRKNHVTLIRAFAQLRRRAGVPHVLVLAGDRGWGTEAIFAAVEETGMSDAVRFLGAVERQLLPALYAGADVFAYPSLYEGFGLPVLEAMACGTPVIAANVASLPEVIGDAGLLVDPCSEAELAAALERLLHDAVLRVQLRTAGLRRARHFSWKRCAAETLAVYETALA